MTIAFQNIIAEAHVAGMTAVQNLAVRPMVVQQHAEQMDDSSPVVKEWLVPDGVCGFAWINVKPGNSAFARYLKQGGLAHADGYYGGVTIWVSAFNQSMQKKEAYAHAYADILVSYGIKATANSRMD